MINLLNILKAAALLACISACVSLSMFAVDAARAMRDLHSKIFAVDPARTQLLLDKDLVDLKNILVHVDMTAAQVARTSRDEQSYLKQWNEQVSTAIGDTDALISHLDTNQSRISEAAVGTLSAASATIADVQPALAQVRTVAVTTNATIGDLDRFIQSSDLAESEHNFRLITNNIALTSSDFQTKFHDLLYPPKCQGKLCWVRRGYMVVKAGSEFAEPAYWFEQLVQSIH